MTLIDLERAVDRLENALCAAEIPADVRREIDRFITHVAAEMTELLEVKAEAGTVMARLQKASAN